MASYDSKGILGKALERLVEKTLTTLKDFFSWKNPYKHLYGHTGVAGWNRLCDIKCTSYMNVPFRIKIIPRGYSTSVVEFMVKTSSGKTPDVFYCRHIVQWFDGNFGATSDVGYTYADTDGERTYTFWKKKNEPYGFTPVQVDCDSDLSRLVTVNSGGHSDTEPEGIVYADRIYGSVMVDQTYNAASQNPQSGTAVAGAVASKQNKLGTSGSGSSLKYTINITGTAGIADKATSVTTTPLTTQSTSKYMAAVDDNGNVYTGNALYDMSSNTLAVNINGNANTAASATNYNTSEGGIHDALAGKAALTHSHGFITESGTMTSTDGTFEAGDKLLFIDHNYSGAADIIRAVTNANGVLYFNGTKLNFGTLGVAYGGTGNTNAKAACNSFLASLDEGNSDFDTSKDPYVITGFYDASNATSFYRRRVSKILSWIMAKIPVAGGAMNAHTCKIPYNYAEDNTSGAPAVDYIQYVDGNGTCYNVPCASPNLQQGGLNSDIRRIGLANGTAERTAAEMDTNGATGQIFRFLRFSRSGGLAVLSGAICFRPIAYKVDSSGSTVLTESADWNLMVKASGSGKQFKGASFQPVYAHAVKIHLNDLYVPTTAYGVGVVDDIGTNGIFAKLSSGGILSFTVDSYYNFANFQRGKFYSFSITVTCP